MAMKEDCCAMQLIDSNSVFNADGFDRFAERVKFADCGLSYAVVAIMGPQSSGKSTLMNHLFHTNFKEMDAEKGRSQTTMGIWTAKCVGIEPCTIAVDLEGTDGSERGQDDTAFEKQSALFALAISDVVIINMWCADIGRENAANKPLLRTVFEVMMRLRMFSPHKRTLLFVIRDKSKTPFETLKNLLKKDMQKIWDGVLKPQAHESTLLDDIFIVQVVALSSYEHREKKFKEEVGALRQHFPKYISQGGLASDRIPASAFSLSAQNIWNVIKENRDLDLPNHRVMVATVRCGEIATEKFNQLKENKDWLACVEAAETSPVPGFGEKLTSILNTYLSEYDKETMYFDEGERNKTKKLLLESKALDSVHATFTTMIGHLCSKVLEEFKVRLEKSLKEGSFDSTVSASCIEPSLREFDKGCKDATIQKANWDSSSIRNKLRCDIDAHASYVRSELVVKYEKQLSESLATHVDAILQDGRSDAWASIRSILYSETEDALSKLSTVIGAFNVDKETIAKTKQDFRDCARKVVDKIVRDKTEDQILTLMKHRFEIVFLNDSDKNPRVWTQKELIRAAAKDGRSSSLKVLSVMAAICLDDGKPNNIEKSLFSSLMDETKASKDHLASNTWEGVSPEEALITPVRCKSLWETFERETHHYVTEANSARETIELYWMKELGKGGKTKAVSAVGETEASGSQPAKRNTRGPCRQLKTAKVTWRPCRQLKTANVTRVTNSRINIRYDERHQAAPTADQHSSLAHDIGHVIRTHCPMKWKSWKVMPDEMRTEVCEQLSTNYNLEDLDDESLAYVNRLFAERYKQWKSDLHYHFQAFDDPQVALQEGCPKELEGREDSWAWLCGHFQESDYVKKAKTNKCNRDKKTFLHHSSSRPFSYRMEERRLGESKFPEIDVFGDVSVRPGNELGESLHATMMEKSQLVFQESASQLPPNTPLKSVDPPQDAKFQILTETLDQTLGRRPGTYCRGMGNDRQGEPRAPSSLQSNSQVTALTTEVAALTTEVTALTAEVAELKTQLASYNTQMSQLLESLVRFGIPVLDFGPPTTSEPL